MLIYLRIHMSIRALIFCAVLLALIFTACTTDSLPPATTAGLTETQSVTPSPEPSPTATPLPYALRPIASGSTIGIHKWSPGETFFARWPDWPSDDLSFVNVTTGEECPSPVEISWGFHNRGRVEWLSDDKVLLMSDTLSRALIYTPCTDEIEEITHLLPTGFYHIQSPSPDRSKILLFAETGQYIYDIAEGRTTLIDPRVTVQISSTNGVEFFDGVAWSPDGTRFSVVSNLGKYTMVAWMVDTSTGSARQLSHWTPEHDATHADFENAMWLNDDLLYVNNAVASGPYFFEPDHDKVVNIATDLFSQPLSQCSEYHCDHHYQGKLKISTGSSDYHLLLNQWLLHSESGEIEELPQTTHYYFSPEGEWLVAHVRGENFIETISVRPLESISGEFVPIYTGALKDFADDGRNGALLWFDNDSRIGISTDTFAVYKVPPDGEQPLIVFEPENGDVWSNASPSGRYLLIGTWVSGVIYLVDTAALEP